MSQTAAAVVNEPANKPGQGRLVFETVRGQTVVRSCQASAPLRLITPANHGSAVWVYASSFGGGFVGGDHIQLDVDVGKSSRAVLMSQSATKIYRSSSSSSQTIIANIEAEATLVVMPDPLVAFAGSTFVQTQRYSLHPSASLLLVDTVVSGRSASGERWLFDRLQSRIDISRNGNPLFIEALDLDKNTGALPHRFGRFEAIALIVLLGPAFTSVREQLLAILHRPLTSRPELITSISTLGEDGLTIRLAGTNFESLQIETKRLLDFLPDLLGDNPWARKW